ncbi:MAG: small ribosomal subunit Rsm22 family protein [Chloroflexota bacterium]
MSVELPAALAEAIEDQIQAVPPRELAQASAALTARYREKRSPGGPVARTPADLLAYLAARLPATYAAISSVLAEVRWLRPAWQPQSVLDLGAGPGTGLWSATAYWPGVQRATAVEAEPQMLALGRKLATVAPYVAVRDASWVAADVTATAPGGPYDLVLLAFVLGEVPPSRLDAVIEQAAAATAITDGVTVIVEPGTPDGFARVRRARELLLERGGSVTAPCPHDAACPIPNGDWCHFSVRLARSQAHRLAKSGALGYEDEKFAYVAVTRGPTAHAEARILRHPQTRPGNIRLELCTPAGLTSQVVTRSQKEAFRQARKAAWGDAWD